MFTQHVKIGSWAGVDAKVEVEGTSGRIMRVVLDAKHGTDLPSNEDVLAAVSKVAGGAEVRFRGGWYGYEDGYNRHARRGVEVAVKCEGCGGRGRFCDAPCGSCGGTGKDWVY